MEFKMNIYIGWLFKLIPLVMGIICIALGDFILSGSGQSEYFVAGHVLISLSAICLALFTTAFIIISQLTHGVNKLYNTLFPVIGYAGSVATMIWGWSLLASDNVMADEFVAGHVIFGVGMIAACYIDCSRLLRSFSVDPEKCCGQQKRRNTIAGLFFTHWQLPDCRAATSDSPWFYLVRYFTAKC